MPVIFNTIYAFGDDSVYYYTQPGIAVSYDSGATWTKQETQPVPIHQGIRSANGNYAGWLLTTNSGSAVCNQDETSITTWGPAYYFSSPPRQIIKIFDTIFEFGFLGIGFEKDPATKAEYATIVFTQNGVDESAWATRYKHTDPQSGLYDLLLDPNTGIAFAVGYKNQFRDPLMLWSSDNGQTWDEVDLPSSITGALFSIDGTSNQFRMGGVGKIITGNWNQGVGSYTVSSGLLVNGKAKAITYVSSNFDISQPIQTLALSGNTIFYSDNGFDYQSISQPGYTFNTAVYVASRWILGCSSILNQYTGFYGNFEYTPDPVLKLEGYNNGVHAYKFIVR